MFMQLTHFLIRTLSALLFLAFGTVAAFAVPGDWTPASYPVVAQELSVQPVNLTNTSRAPPPASANVMATGAAPVQIGSLRALAGADTTGSASALLRSSIAPNNGVSLPSTLWDNWQPPAGYTRHADGSVTHIGSGQTYTPVRDSSGNVRVDGNGNPVFNTQSGGSTAQTTLVNPATSGPTITPPAPNTGLPSGYTRNADGTIIGPGGGIARDTGHVDASGNIVLRRDSGGYYTVDANGNQASVPSPYTDGAPPVHHVCTNKNCTSTANGGPWTPRFEEYFDNAGLNINSEINKIVVPGHRGPHPAEYHQYVYSQLDEVTQGLTPNTPAYTNAVSNTLNDIKVEAVTPGNQVNDWLTGN